MSRDEQASMKTKWRELVGRRVLVTTPLMLFHNKVVEAEVLEVSPSGEYVKLKFWPHGRQSVEWVRADAYVVVEVLG